MGEVGKNMTVYEYGDDIIIVDVGVGFPEEEMFGVDLVIPDITYLHDKLHRIRGIFITHGHEDHIGSLPYLLTELGNPPIYGTPLTLGLIGVKLRERHLLEKAILIPMGPEDVIEAGAFTIEPFRVCHSIPDAVGFGITTPAGLIVHTGDYKFDLTPVDGRPTDFGKIAALGNRGVLALVTDCVHVETPGFTASERVVEEAFDRIFAQTDGRIIVATFASLISRIQQVVDVAQRYGRKVCPIGRSMENNVEMALGMDYLHDPQRVLVDVKRAAELPPNRVAYVVTGSQGEPMAALSRIAGGDHRQLKVMSGDTVVISATPIPGNEKSVYKTINNLYKLGATVVHGTDGRSHVSGHASQEELLLMLNLVRPEFFVPVHGEYRMLVVHGQLAAQTGVHPENVFVLENGDVLEFTQSHGDKVGKTYGGHVMVDGSGVGDIGDAVLRDRKALSNDGIMMVVVSIDSEEARIIAGPDIVTRGVFYLPESDGVLTELRDELRAIIDNCSVEGIRDLNTVKEHIRSGLAKAVFARSKRRPIVIPVVMEV